MVSCGARPGLDAAEAFFSKRGAKLLRGARHYTPMAFCNWDEPQETKQPLLPLIKHDGRGEICGFLREPG